LSVCVSLLRAEEVSEGLQFFIRYMEAMRADLKQLFRNVSPACSKDELCYRIQEIINVLDVGVQEAWEIYMDHPSPFEVYWDMLNKIDE
jgi:hypothetical protein